MSIHFAYKFQLSNCIVMIYCQLEFLRDDVRLCSEISRLIPEEGSALAPCWPLDFVTSFLRTREATLNLLIIH